MFASFHFTVGFTGINGITDADARFELVSGIAAARQEALPAGAGREKQSTLYQPLIFTRALPVPQQSVLHQWIQQCIRSGVYPVLPGIEVHVLNHQLMPVVSLLFKNCTLKNWQLSELNAVKDGILMEEIQFDYIGMTIRSV
jgi:hypothetical protein